MASRDELTFQLRCARSPSAPITRLRATAQKPNRRGNGTWTLPCRSQSFVRISPPSDRRLTSGACFGPRLASPAEPSPPSFPSRRSPRTALLPRARRLSPIERSIWPHCSSQAAAGARDGRPSGIPVIEYGSLTCPHCATFSREVFPELKKDYIDTGKVRFIFASFAQLPRRCSLSARALHRRRQGLRRHRASVQ